MTKYLWFVAIVCMAGTLSAQQLSLFTQYRENATLINPAAMESDFLAYGYNMTLGANYRVQWAGLSGAPTTQTVRLSYINKEWSGATLSTGGYLFNDRTGPTGFTGLYGRIGGVISPDPEFAGLSLALSGGFVQYRVDSDKVQLRQTGDVIGEQDQMQFYPDLGVGVYYYQMIDGGALDGDFLYMGVSAPQLLGLDLTFTDDNGEFFVQRVRHYYGMFGLYKFFRNDSYLEPSLWVKYVNGAPLNADINLRYQMPTSFWIGTGVSTAGNFHLEAGINLGDNVGFDNNIKIGYAYDYSFSTFGPAAGNTHELQLSFSFDK